MPPWGHIQKGIEKGRDSFQNFPDDSKLVDPIKLAANPEALADNSRPGLAWTMNGGFLAYRARRCFASISEPGRCTWEFFMFPSLSLLVS